MLTKLETRPDSATVPVNEAGRFLERNLTELKILEEEAETHYHGVLAQMLKAARYETEVLLRDEAQCGAWPRSPEQPRLKVR